MKIKLRRNPRKVHWKHRFNSSLVYSTIMYSQNGTKSLFGMYGLKAKESCKLQWFHFEAIRKNLAKICKNRISLHLHAQLNIPLTVKPGMRMGKGKGKLKYWVTNIYKGQIILEFGFMTLKDWRYISRLLRNKIPFRFCLVRRQE